MVKEFKVKAFDQEIATQLFKYTAPSIAKNSKDLGFELLGLDFMIDDKLKVWLIEVNQNPCLSTLSSKQGTLISALVSDVMR